MNATLHLVISTPASVLVDERAVVAVRASDASGSFGVLPGAADVITVLADSVVRWRDAENRFCYCAVRSGVLMVELGKTVRIACREGLTGDNLGQLETRVREQRTAETDANREYTLRQMRLHTQTMRQIMSYLRPTARVPITQEAAIAADTTVADINDRA